MIGVFPITERQRRYHAEHGNTPGKLRTGKFAISQNRANKQKKEHSAAMKQKGILLLQVAEIQNAESVYNLLRASDAKWLGKTLEEEGAKAVKLLKEKVEMLDDAAEKRTTRWSR